MKKLDFENSTVRPNAFRVPDGYFEGLTAQVMNHVAEAKVESERPQKAAAKLPFWKTELYAKVKPYIYMAAMISSIYFGVWVYKYQQRLMADKVTASTTATATDTVVQPLASDMTAQETTDYVDDACNYMMTDGNDIMAYLTEEHIEY